MRFLAVFRGQQGSDKKGLGTITPHNLQQGDDEFEAYRKRMMMAYRFLPNPQPAIMTRFILCVQSLCYHLCVLIAVAVAPVVVEAQQPEADNKDNAENRVCDAQEISSSGYLLLVFLTLSFFD